MIPETAKAWGACENFKRCPLEFRETEGKAMPPFGLVAIIGTWNEADIIEACVKNCFAQGVDEVFIVDNTSNDATWAIAKAAGATLADVYETDYYLEAERVLQMNGVAVAVAAHGDRNLWILSLDADEFVQGIGMTLKEWLAKEGGSFDGIGAMAFDHYPTGLPANIPGFHPAEFQPCGMVRRYAGKKNPWKVPLLRYRAGQPLDLCQTRGMHGPWAADGRRVTIQAEPNWLVMHHVCYREEEDTRLRLELLCEPRPDFDLEYRSFNDDIDIDSQGAMRRWRSLDAVYSQQWVDVEVPHSQVLGKCDVRLWPHQLSADRYQWERWYTEEALEAAVAEYRERHA